MSGGETGIRTLKGSIEPVSCRFFVAWVTTLTRNPVPHCPPLPTDVPVVRHLSARSGIVELKLAQHDERIISHQRLQEK